MAQNDTPARPFTVRAIAWAFVLGLVGASAAYVFARIKEATEPTPTAYRVTAKRAVVTDHDGCGDSSGGKYAGMEPQWTLKVNGELLSTYTAPQRANFKGGTQIPASGSLVWSPKGETDLLRFDGDICDLDGDPPRCALKGSIQEAVAIVDGEVKLATGGEPQINDEGFLVLNAEFESECGFAFHVEVVPTAM